MIRINLLGQTRPKASRRPVDTGAALPLVFIGAGVLLGGLFLFYFYHSWQTQLNDENKRIQQLQAQKTDLEQIKIQVEAFEKQKIVLQQRVGTIEQLQRDRTGAQELLDQVANTVSRAENLWLMSLSKKGTTLTMDGAAASLNSVANFITALKRSGYFQKVEIKDAKQDDKNLNVQTYLFSINAEIAPAKTHLDGLAMLDKGEIVAYFADRAILSYLASKSSDASKLRLADNYFSLEPYALALPHGDEDFRLAVDRALSHIYRSGEIGIVFAHTFGNQMQPSDILKSLYSVSALPD